VYTTAHAAPNTITWQEFRDSFRAHHIPTGVLKLKQRDFLARATCLWMNISINSLSYHSMPRMKLILIQRGINAFWMIW
jgi:hypothetical protein